MMRNIKLILLLVCTIVSVPLFSTTWDEPWQDEIIRKADCFVLAKVISCDNTKGVTVEISKTLGGKALSGMVKISDFYLTHICSSSGGRGPEFHFQEGSSYYFFLSKNDQDKYCIATPTAGSAIVTEGDVVATYRHSYHQALIPIDVYEKTMKAIFNHYHNIPFDAKYVTEYVRKYLTMNPVGLTDKESAAVFFAQHVALECIYHLRLSGFYSNILPFLNDLTNPHSSISAARAMIAYNTPESKEALIRVISDKSRDTFLQVMCIWTLADFKPVEMKTQLERLEEDASEGHNGFGGNIMDPRICTSIPTVKDALHKLISDL